MRVPLLKLVGFAILFAVAGTLSGQPPRRVDRADTPPPSRITVDNYKRISVRKDSVTEKEVISILGQPSVIRIGINAGNDYNMMWEHRAFIEVQLKNDRVRHTAAGFSSHVTSKLVTLENFKKTHAGMTEDDVRKILGVPTGADSALAANFTNDGDSLAWEELPAISIDWKNGKITGMVMLRPANK